MSDGKNFHVPMAENKAPAIITGDLNVRYRDKIDPNVPRIDRYWKENETGITFEVTRFLRVIGEVTGLRVVIRDAKYGRERAIWLRELQKDFSKIGNHSSQF